MNDDNKYRLVLGCYHDVGIFLASCRICSKKRAVASSLVRLASSAASFINCESMASEGSSMLVKRYVSMVCVIIFGVSDFADKDTNNFRNRKILC